LPNHQSPAWLRALASLKLTIVLLVAVLGILTVGTLVESTRGTEAARSIYYAPWFHAVLVLFGANLLASIVDRFPWGRFRIGFLMTHLSMVVILAGAAMSHFLAVDGQLAVWEGEETATFRTFGPGDRSAEEQLPFLVRLEAFEIDYYPGTRRPAMFRSRVVVRDPQGGQPVSADIEMNRELAYGGYRLFQSSYRQAEDRDMTVLSVSRDPGQPVVFVGYILLVAGMITVLTTRIVQRREAARSQARLAAAGLGSPTRAGVLLAVGLALAAGSARAADGISGLPDRETVDRLRGLPVQYDGRVMPLDTFAREMTWEITGEWEWPGIDPVELVLACTFAPSEWAMYPLVRVGSEELASAAGLPPGTKHAAYDALAGNGPLLDLIRHARRTAQREERVTGVLEDALDLEDRLLRMRSLLMRSALLTVPVSGDPVARWSPPRSLEGPSDLVAAVDETIDPELLEKELTYNRVRPRRLAWWILVPATLASVGAWLRPRRWLEVLSLLGLAAGFAVMTWGIAVRWQIAGRIPASNMYESLLFLGWGVGLFALIATAFLRNRLVILNATAMSALTMILVDRLPIDPFLHPMAPVLSGTPWLAIHVPIIMVSYSVLALGVLVAHMRVGLEIFAPRRRKAAATMSDLLYWYVHVGSILLIAGILTGSIWAASSWGRYWGWDPKEVWSLIAFLAYMAILHGRLDRVIGTFGVALASIVAFWSILMTYIGVNYVLATGLHSYGFGSSGIVNTMLLIAGFETAFLLAGAWAHHRNRPLRERRPASSI
jgi:cytochrome c-type biogenesis protein CcsB